MSILIVNHNFLMLATYLYTLLIKFEMHFFIVEDCNLLGLLGKQRSIENYNLNDVK